MKNYEMQRPVPQELVHVSHCILLVVPSTSVNYLYRELISVQQFLKNLPSAVQLRKV